MIVDAKRARRRREHGEGSISQRKDGRYQVAVTLNNGKRRYLYAQTREEAETLLALLLTERQTLARTCQALAAFLADPAIQQEFSSSLLLSTGGVASPEVERVLAALPQVIAYLRLVKDDFPAHPGLDALAGEGEWDVFARYGQSLERRWRRGVPAVTLQAQGKLTFNKKAMALLGNPAHVSLAYERERNIIRIGAAAEHTEQSTAVRKGAGGAFAVAAKAFATYYGLAANIVGTVSHSRQGEERSCVESLTCPQ